MSGRIQTKIKSKRAGKSVEENLDRNPEDEPDMAVLSKPFETNISGLTNALKALNTATSEVRDYLTYECEILYECRVCRSIFRSVSNFILHKRSYCQTKYNCVIHLKCSNHKSEYTNVNEKEPECKNEPKISTEKPKKTLDSVVETLAQKKQFGFERKDFSISDFYRSENEDQMIDLEHILESDSAVFQTVFGDDCENKVDEMKLEVTEIHNMLEGHSVVLGADGKILDINKGNTTRTGIISGDNSSGLDRTCTQCDIRFATRKTYASHMKYKHADSRLVYPCPECSEVYASSWSVYRHLFNIHRKTLSQVRKLRENIQSKAFYQVQTSIKKSPQSSKTNINEQQRIDDENQEWMDNFESDNDIQMCGGCGKRFERRAALNSHSQTCQKRIAARNTIVVNRSKRNAAAEEKCDKKQVKIPKLETIPEIKGASKRKSNILKKRKIGIQIRYDYTKPNDKNISSLFPSNEEKDIKQNSGDETSEKKDLDDEELIKYENSDKIFLKSELVSNTEELYSIIGIASEKIIQEDVKDTTASITEPEILSIHSSNNTTPEKDESTLRNQDTDSEIEEIFGSPSVIMNPDTYHMSDITNSYKNEPNSDKNINENTLKLIQLMRTDSPQKTKISIDDRMNNYVDIKKLQCIPCNIRFGNISKLRCHMSLHFNWMRFCCDICLFKSYEKTIVYDHVKTDHNVIEPDKIDAVIFQIPEWETIEMSSENFIDLDDELKINEQKIENEIEEKCSTPDSCIILQTEIMQPKTPKGRGRPPKRKNIKTVKLKKKHENNDEEETKLTEEDVSTVDKDSNEMKNIKDMALRKMVFEVIFGQNSDQVPDTDKLTTEIKENNLCVESTDMNIVSRPIRNRVKPVNKDFIYDLNEFTDMPRSVSQNSNRSLGQHEKHVTGSLDDLSVGKHKIKKSGKRPVPKCKMMYSFDVSGTRIVNLHLQNSGQDKKECMTEDGDNNQCCRDAVSAKSSNGKVSVNVVDSDICIIEDD